MNRKEFQDLAYIRLEEAQALLKNGKYDGAYYLCGYSIECGLKACVAKKIKRYDFPDKDFVRDSYVHDLKQLMKTAGFYKKLDDYIKANDEFASNWAVVKDWTEESRYKRIGKIKARDFFNAVVNKRNGVFQWIRKNW